MNINENTYCMRVQVLNTTTLFSQESGRHGGLMQDKRRVYSQGTENAGLSGVIQGIGLGDVVACCCLTKTLIYFLRLYLAPLPLASCPSNTFTGRYWCLQSTDRPPIL